MQIPKPTSGSIVFEGRELTTMSPKELREARTKVQMIFQDPISSLNPRRAVRESVLEPLDIWKRGTKAERGALVDEILESVGIDPERAAESRPHQFSGGQCQRISVARALVLDPTLIICDEPVSALDVSVQAQVLNLLEDLKIKYGLTLMFIAHDLAVVKNVSDRVAVMYLGKLCEVAASDDLYAAAGASLHERPAAVDPRARPRRRSLGGRPRRRVAVAGQPSVGMSLPHPLSERRRPVRHRRAATAVDGRRPFRRLPPSGGDRGHHQRLPHLRHHPRLSTHRDARPTAAM